MVRRILAAATAAVTAAPLRLLVQGPPPLLFLPQPPSSSLLQASTRLYATIVGGSKTRYGTISSKRNLQSAARRRTAPERSPRRPWRGRRRRRESEVEVQIGIEEGLPEDPQILNIAETLRTDVGKAMAVAFQNLGKSQYKTRDASISDVERYGKVELSLLLCDDNFIRKLNKEWRDEDSTTDVLSMSQHVPEFDLPVLLLGDIVISVDTAARQAAERGHTLIDEIRILVVHGFLHLLGFDHEISYEAEVEMETEEQLILNTLGWQGKGLIKSARDVNTEHSNEYSQSLEKSNSPLYRKSRLSSYMICDFEGTLLDSENQVVPASASALREAICKGVNAIAVTARSRSAAIKTLESVNLEGFDCNLLESSPGVYLQGSLVCGRHGQEIFKANIDEDICNEVFSYSLEHKLPVVAFCKDQCLILTEHPLVELLQTKYHEPKARLVASVNQIMSHSSIQKLLLLHGSEEISSILLPYWLEATKGRAHVIQPHPNMLEIIPFGTSKKRSISMLLDHLGIAEEKVFLDKA